MPQENFYRRLIGRVKEGMFPNERSFISRDHQGNPIEVIVSTELVLGEGDHGRLLVRLIASENGYSVIRIPGESLTSPRTVSVRDSELAPA